MKQKKPSNIYGLDCFVTKTGKRFDFLNNLGDLSFLRSSPPIFDLTYPLTLGCALLTAAKESLLGENTDAR